MEHPFGVLLRRHLSRKRGLSQMKLATGIHQPPFIITLMCKGQRLTGPNARNRVLGIIGWLNQEGVLTTLAEANELLTAAGFSWLDAKKPEEARLVNALAGHTLVSRAGTNTRHTNLPLQTTSFVGREREIQEVLDLLTVNRLVTLSGAGGCGKTRLALEVALRMQGAFADGIWLVEMAALSDPSLLPRAVAQIFHLREEPGTPLLDLLTTTLAQKHVLLILDNCEHLIDACAGLVDHLLRNCPELRILVTGRETLRITGETIYTVPPLAVPEQECVDLEMLSSYEAVRLFVARAEAVRSTFSVAAENVPAIVQICRRLDGIPLAIELAAARMKGLTAEQLAARLDDRFRLLTGGSRTALPRHQTLRALIDWSYNLLTEVERVVLCRLAVFSGGWTLEAAESVCAGPSIDAGEMPVILLQLVDKSLVVAEKYGGENRYHFLEIVRQYALERLLAMDEAGTVREQHCRWFVRLAEDADTMLQTPEEATWLRLLDVEYDNLRAALAWSMESDAGLGQRLAAALWRYWYVRGYWSEGRGWLGRALSHDGTTGLAVRAQLLGGAGVLATMQDEYAVAREMYEESLTIRRKLGDTAGIATLYANLGEVAFQQCDYTVARRLYEESLKLARKEGDHTTMPHLLTYLGRIAREQGDSECATALWEEGLHLARETGNRRATASLLACLGQVARDRGDFERAALHLQSGLAIYHELGNKVGIAAALTRLGQIARDQSDFTRAATLHESSLAIYRELADRWGTAECLEHLAAAAADQGYLERAARLWGCAEALRYSIGTPLSPADRVQYARDVAAARSRLDSAAWNAAWTEGGVMPLDAAITHALESSSTSE